MATFMKYLSFLVIFFVFLASIYEFIENNEANRCEMTYMFERPEYIVSQYIYEALL